MFRLLHRILPLMLAFLPVLLVPVQARGQAGDTVCVGGVSTWQVVDVPGDSYVWELYNDVTSINLATDPGNCPATDAYFVGGVNTGDSVNVMCLQPGTYFIKVTATNQCPTNNLKVGMIVVEECYSYAEFRPHADICEGDTAWMTVDITGAPGPWTITYTDGTTTWTVSNITTTPYSFPLPVIPGAPGATYWITSVSNPYMTNYDPSLPVTLTVKPKPITSPIIRY